MMAPTYGPGTGLCTAWPCLCTARPSLYGLVSVRPGSVGPGSVGPGSVPGVGHGTWTLMLVLPTAGSTESCTLGYGACFRLRAGI